MISIIIPVYGDAHTLPRCLAAIAAQAERDFEVIIVDDGSTPPVERIEVPGLTKIRWFRRPHAGAPAARNFGAAQASGAYLLFCDADVVLVSRALAAFKRALVEHLDVSYAYASFRFGWKRFAALPFDADRLRRMPYIHTTSLLRRVDFPGFDPSLQRFQDWDLWLTMLMRGKSGVPVHETLFTIVHTRGTMSRWLPSFVYQLPWKTRRVRAYERARERLFRKHGISA
ncbi:MAG: glycosyltransferase family A protein [bacterium]|nr:glycosyltransferase family A protein [bacterium]